MAIVLAIRDSETICFLLEPHKKKIELEDYCLMNIQAKDLYYDAERDDTDFLNAVLTIKENIKQVVTDYQQHKLYVMLVTGSGQLHDFLKVSNLDIGFEKITEIKHEDDIQRLKDICTRFSNFTANQNIRYSVSIGSITEIPDGYCISCSFIDEKLVEGISRMAEELDIQLFDIQPLGYCLPSIITNPQPYISEVPSGRLCVFDDNFYIVQKYNTNADDSKILQAFYSYLQQELGIAPNFQILTSHDLKLAKEIQINTVFNDDEYMYLLGATALCSNLQTTKEKGEVNGFLHTIKKLFTRRKKAESDI